MSHGAVPVTQLIREDWFWTGVLRDHATFIYDGLPPSEQRAAEAASSFRRLFGTLHEEVEALARSAGLSGPAGSYAEADAPATDPLSRWHGMELTRYNQAAEALNRRALEGLQALRRFKEELLYQKLDCSLTLHLGPGLLQHMINEAEEAYRVLTGLREQANLPPAMEALHHHLLWLPDASGHAWALHGGLAATEQELQQVTMEFKQVFDGLHITAMELFTMLRVAPRMVGVLRRLNRNSMDQIKAFRSFLLEMREHLEACEIGGTLSPLFADHMLREELYYTEKMMLLGEQK